MQGAWLQVSWPRHKKALADTRQEGRAGGSKYRSHGGAVSAWKMAEGASIQTSKHENAACHEAKKMVPYGKLHHCDKLHGQTLTRCPQTE